MPFARKVIVRNKPVHDLISWPSGQLEGPDLLEIRMVAARFGFREATMPANPALAASFLPVQLRQPSPILK